jgi:hypothetical protein
MSDSESDALPLGYTSISYFFLLYIFFLILKEKIYDLLKYFKFLVNYKIFFYKYFDY